MASTAAEHVAPGHAASSTRPGVWLTEIALVAMALIWGVNFSVVKFGTTVVSPLAFNGLRVAGAAAFLLAIVGLVRAPLPPARTVFALLALGVLGNGVYQFLFIEGIALTRASDAALVIGATPAFIAIISRVRRVERATRRGVAGIALSVAGIALVVLGTARSGDARSSLTGDALVLAASMAWATYTVLLKPYTEHVDGLHISAFTMLGGAVVLALAGLPEIAAADWARLPPLGWAAAAYSAIFALVIAYYFWYHGVRVIGPTRTAMFSNLQPIIAVLVAWPLLHEIPTPWQIVGGACIVTGLLMTRA